MAIYCVVCGEENRPGAVFCRFCGQTLTDEASNLAESSSSTDPTEIFPAAAAGSFQEGETELEIFPEEDTDRLEVLEVGQVLQNRFQITRVIAEEQDSILYEAEDRLRCWNCQAVQFESISRFCEVCGAEMVQRPRVYLRAQPLDQELQIAEREWFQIDNLAYQVEIPAQPEHAGSAQLRFRLVSGFHSHVGQIRDVDEDSILALQLDGICEMKSAPALGFFAVADGIGGHDAGEVASRVAVHSLAAQIMERVYIPTLGGNKIPTELLVDNLRASIRAANQAILDLRETVLIGSSMGCTLTAALVSECIAVVANVGDSRTYLMHDGKLTQITRDHSMAARMIEQNLIRPNDIYSFEQKGVIYRSLGDNPDLAIDIEIVELAPGDRLMLCSDGLWDMVRDSFIEDALLEQYEPQQASEHLVELANLAGGEDNISVIVVDIRSFL